MIRKQRREQQTRAIAASLAEQLTKSRNDDDENVKLFLGKLLDEHFFGFASESPSADIGYDDIIKSREYQRLLCAVPISVSMMKATVDTSPDGMEHDEARNESPKSFSLLDQLQGGLLASFFSIHEVLECRTDEERLAALTKVTHLDDIAADWNELKPILSHGLTNFDDDGIMSSKYLHLLRTWFDQGRSSTEYGGLLYDFCRMVMSTTQDRMIFHSQECARKSTEHDSANYNELAYNDTVMIRLVEAWHDMWLDIMLRGVYSAEAAKEIEITMLLWLRDKRPMVSFHGEDLPSESFISQIILSLIDPQARWFSTWVDLISPHRLVLLLDLTGVLPSIWRRCTIPWAGKGHQASLPTNGRRKTVLCHSLRLHSVAILSATVSSTRVSHFPWHQVVPSQLSDALDNTNLNLMRYSVVSSIQRAIDGNEHKEATIKTPKLDQLEGIIDVFVTALEQTKSDLDDLWIDQLCHSIEAMVCGCKRFDVKIELKMIKNRLSDIDDTTDSPVNGLLRKLDNYSECYEFTVHKAE